MNHVRIAALLLLVVCVSACATTTPPSPAAPESGNSFVKLPVVENALTISAPDVQTDGRLAKVRGRVTNNLGEDIDGIRYLVTIESRGEPARTLDRFQREVSQHLAAGEAAMMRLDVESMYFGSASQMSIIAVPKKLGDRVLPAPSDWK